jgi:Mn-dependent DtxR family transcriptional regulator
MVENARYRRVYLTEAGRAVASGVAEKHKTIRRFFVAFLDLDNKIADTDACAIEHVISDEAVAAMRGRLREHFRKLSEKADERRERQG